MRRSNGKKDGGAAEAGARGRRGFALVVVLLLVVIIATTAGAFSMRTSGAYRLARSRTAGWQMYYAARGAIEQAKVSLWRELVAPGGKGIAAAPDPLTVQAGDVEVTITYIDESGKFPINGFTSPDEGRRTELALALARLLEGLSVPNAAPLAQSARDYIDKDTDGAYESGALNSDIYEISQLLSARGFEPKFLYVSRKEGLPAPVDVLSTWHTNAININSAGPELLKVLAPRLTDADIKAIIAARKEKTFQSMEEVASRTKVAGEGLAELGKWAGFTTDTFALRAEAKLGGFVKRIEAVVWLESTAAHTLYIREGWEY